MYPDAASDRAPVLMTSQCTSSGGGSGTGVMSKVVQSIRIPCPATPPIEAIWSSNPVGTPRAACSAAWQRRARASRSASVVAAAPRASALATSSAALDESPLPAGMVDVTRPWNPAVGRSSATTPAT